MLKPLPVFLALFGVCSAALAQDMSPGSGAAKSKAAVVKPTDKPAFVPTSTSPADATPAPRSPSVFQRIFGTRQNKRTLFPATPEPPTDPATPTPPTAKTTAKKAKSASSVPPPGVKKRKPKPKATEEEPDPSVAKTGPTKPATDTTEPAAPSKKSRKGKATPGVAAKDGTEPSADADAETKEKLRFDQAKAQAAEDPGVKELKAKADEAVSDEEARTAQRAYNKALFSKMRKIDGSLDARIDQMEAAILKRLGEK